MFAALPATLRRFVTDPLLVWSMGLVAGWRFLLELLNLTVRTAESPLQHWAHWDGGWYLSIISAGYQYHPQAGMQENVAFFPAFPVFIKALAAIIPIEPVLIGFVCNTVLTVVAIYLAMKLTQLLAPKTPRAPLFVGLGLLAYPASFFLGAFYAEALLLCGVLGAIYCALTKRLWLAAICIGIAASAKVIGIVAAPVVMVIVYEQWRAADIRLRQLIKQWFIILCGSAGLWAYMVYLGLRFGEPLAFYHVQAAWGRNTGEFFLDRIIQQYAHSLTPAYFGGRYGYILALFCMALPFIVVGLAAIAWRAQQTWWPVAATILILLLPLSTGSLDSLNRYCLLAVGILLPCGLPWLQKRLPSWVLWSIAGGSVLLMLFFARGFLDGSYFAG